MKTLHCDTIEQFLIYEWIKENFILHNITLTIGDSRTILLDDSKESVRITLKNRQISFEYPSENGLQVDIYELKRTRR